MAQQLLDRADVRAAFQQVPCERVSQHMRRDLFVQLRPLRRAQNEMLEGHVRQMMPPPQARARIVHQLARRPEPPPLSMNLKALRGGGLGLTETRRKPPPPATLRGGRDRERGSSTRWSRTQEDFKLWCSGECAEAPTLAVNQKGCPSPRPPARFLAEGGGDVVRGSQDRAFRLVQSVWQSEELPACGPPRQPTLPHP